MRLFSLIIFSQNILILLFFSSALLARKTISPSKASTWRLKSVEVCSSSSTLRLSLFICFSFAASISITLVMFPSTQKLGCIGENFTRQSGHFTDISVMLGMNFSCSLLASRIAFSSRTFLHFCVKAVSIHLSMQPRQKRWWHGRILVSHRMPVQIAHSKSLSLSSKSP